jgi:hypothetical protein
MARLTAKERRERVAAFQALVEQSRQIWLGKWVTFDHPLDKKIKRGKVTEINATGLVTVEYQLIDGVPGCMLLQVGHEAENLTVIDEP